MDLTKIEERIDKTIASSTEIGMDFGGVRFTSLVQLMEMAKLISISKEAVPQHLRGEPGMCFAICVQALEWRFSPFAVANKSYLVNGRLAYESQLVHAVIEQRAPLDGRLRHSFEGDGDDRVCVVTGRVKGEKAPFEYKSPKFGSISPKNSPLWKVKPDLQLYYNTVRDFCRVYFPDVLLGVYTEDELKDSLPKDVTPAKPDIAARLEGGKGKRGFNRDQIDKTIDGKADEPQTPDVRAIAYEKGSQAFDAGLPLTAHGSTDPIEIEAFADGWRARNSEVAPAEAA